MDSTHYPRLTARGISIGPGAHGKGFVECYDLCRRLGHDEWDAFTSTRVVEYGYSAELVERFLARLPVEE